MNYCGPRPAKKEREKQKVKDTFLSMKGGLLWPAEKEREKQKVKDTLLLNPNGAFRAAVFFLIFIDKQIE